jgi:hypothetical protein
LLRRSTEVRRVTLAEKLAHPGKFSLKGEYVVPKSVKRVTERTAFVTASRRKDALAGVTHSKAAKERLAGERGYGTAAAEEQAARTREVARIKRELKTAVGAARPRKIKSGPRRGEYHWRRERVSDNARGKYLEWRRKKLSGKLIEEGDWHEMMTAARAVNDPMLNLLMKS